MDMKTNPHWTYLCSVDEIPQLGSRLVQREEGNIAVFRTVNDHVFALLDRCPHKAGPLSQGIVHGETVTCPLHSWQIDLTSGEAKAPDVGCARRFPVKVDNGEIFLELSSSN